MNLEERIARLEKANRRWRQTATALMLGLLFIVSAGAFEQKLGLETISRNIRAKRITFVNDGGKEVGFISTEEKGVSLSLKSSDGEGRIVCKVTDNHPSLTVTGNEPVFLIASLSNRVVVAKDRISIDRMMSEQQRKAASLKESQTKPQDSEKAAETMHISNVIGMGTLPTSGGYIDVFNRYEQNVVSILPDLKDDTGTIYLNRRGGTIGRVLAATH